LSIIERGKKKGTPFRFFGKGKGYFDNFWKKGKKKQKMSTKILAERVL